MKLTEPQRKHLERAFYYSCTDSSGLGCRIEDWRQLQIFERLSAKGLVRITAANRRAFILPAGRWALGPAREPARRED